MKWDQVELRWYEYFPVDPDLGDPDFAVGSGDGLALMVLVDNALLASTTLSWVGDVPDAGTVTNPMTPNAFNFIMIPLDQYATYGSPGSPAGTALTLANDITNVTRVMKWDMTEQRWFEYYPVDPDLGDPDFDVFTGYPYLISINASGPTQWP